MKYLALILICSHAVFCNAQHLVVELSVRWQTKEHHLRSISQQVSTNMVTPYLFITYRNLTDRNIYFKKLTEDYLPPVTGELASIHTLMGLREGKESISFSQYAPDKHYVVDVSNSAQFSNGWVVLEDTTQKEYVLPYINDELNVINTIFTTQEYLNTRHPAKQLVFFNYPEKDTISWRTAWKWKMEDNTNKNTKNTEMRRLYEKQESDSLLTIGHIKDKFCFLEKEETYTQKINLLSFALLGGRYAFVIRNSLLVDYILTDPFWDEEQKQGKSLKIQLPQRFGKYHLFTGSFLTNSVTLELSPLNKEVNNLELGMP